MGTPENDHDKLPDDISKVLVEHLDAMQTKVSGTLRRQEAIDAAVHHFCLMPQHESLHAMRAADGRHLDPNWHEITK